MWTHTQWIIAAWTTVVPLLVLFSIIALVLASRLRTDEPESTESFLTARHSVKGWAIGWSFFAGAVGSWVIGAPANYATYAGVLGIFMYAIAAGFPVLLIAAFGGKIMDKMPHVTSAPEFMGWRFGPLGQIYVMLLVLFNMSIAMLAEYTTMAGLFKDFVGTIGWPLVLTIALLTLLYTMIGGLLISVVTDQFQGILALGLVVTVATYIGVEFRSPAVQGPLPQELKGFNQYGYSAILTMPVSLAASTMFSEAMWQRAWASKSRKALWSGAICGSVLIAAVVFFFGFCGTLATWAGLIVFDPQDPNYTNPNLYVFQLFRSNGEVGNTMLNTWIELLIVILAAVMSQGAVDSLQTGIMSVISSYLLKTQPLFFTRFMIIIVNIPLIIVALRVPAEQMSILGLFLIANMATTASVIPTMIGIADGLRPYYGGDQMFFSCLLSLLGTGGYGCYQHYHASPVKPKVNGALFAAGFKLAYFTNGYRWDFFVAALVISIACVILTILVGCFFYYTLGWKVPTLSKGMQGVEDYVYGCWSAPYARAGVKGDLVDDEEGKTQKVAHV